MRTLLTLGLLLGLAASGYGQQLPAASAAPSSGCWPVANRERVVVQKEDGTQQKGTLLCLGPQEVMLVGSDVLPLSSVRQIAKPKDGVFDGVLKGASVGLVIFLICGGECDSEYLLRGTLSYAAMGGIIDAIQSNDKMIYRKDIRAPSLAWRIRF